MSKDDLHRTFRCTHGDDEPCPVEEHIKAQVADLPPLTPEQVERLTRLLTVDP